MKSFSFSPRDVNAGVPSETQQLQLVIRGSPKITVSTCVVSNKYKLIKQNQTLVDIKIYPYMLQYFAVYICL